MTRAAYRLPSDYVNGAGILATDKPADVVRKLDAAARAAATAPQSVARTLSPQEREALVNRWVQSGGPASTLIQMVELALAATAPAGGVTDEQIIEACASVGLGPSLGLKAGRAVLALTTAARAAGSEFTDTARAALLWVLWHHQGASSNVGQPIRFALGMGAHDRLTEHQVREAKLWRSLTETPPTGTSNEGGEKP